MLSWFRTFSVSMLTFIVEIDFISPLSWVNSQKRVYEKKCQNLLAMNIKFFFFEVYLTFWKCYTFFSLQDAFLRLFEVCAWPKATELDSGKRESELSLEHRKMQFFTIIKRSWMFCWIINVCSKIRKLTRTSFFLSLNFKTELNLFLLFSIYLA